jgi:hypothetical protein
VCYSVAGCLIGPSFFAYLTLYFRRLWRDFTWKILYTGKCCALYIFYSFENFILMTDTCFHIAFLLLGPPPTHIFSHGINLEWILKQCFGSESGLDPDSGGQKWPTKIEFLFKISCFEMLDVLFWGLKAEINVNCFPLTMCPPGTSPLARPRPQPPTHSPRF